MRSDIKNEIRTGPPQTLYLRNRTRVHDYMIEFMSTENLDTFLALFTEKTYDQSKTQSYYFLPRPRNINASQSHNTAETNNLSQSLDKSESHDPSESHDQSESRDTSESHNPSQSHDKSESHNPSQSLDTSQSNDKSQ